MDRKDKRPTPAGLPAQHADYVASLPQIETIKWFVHEKQRVRRKQSQR
jgi:hypothetical protein